MKNLIKIWSGRVPGASRIAPGPFRNTPERRKCQKKQFLPAPADVQTFAGDGFGTILGPGRDPKIDKKRPRERKSVSGDGVGSDFCRFFVRCRSEWLSGSIFGGSDPSKLCSHHNGSTILTKSPFSKKHRKSSLRGPVLGPKIAKSRRRGDLKSQKNAKKTIFDVPCFRRFFACEKNRKKIEKQAVT